jgi:hypothetical protein
VTNTYIKPSSNQRDPLAHAKRPPPGGSVLTRQPDKSVPVPTYDFKMSGHAKSVEPPTTISFPHSQFVLSSREYQCDLLNGDSHALH